MPCTLYYVHDPMCSWCWGFSPVWREIKAAVSVQLDVHYVTGGLAPDTEELMPTAMQDMLQKTWRHIEQAIPGTPFNHTFWTSNSPRRATYGACRAVLAATSQHPEFEETMIAAIQRAYYVDALNPSDDTVLVTLAADMGCDVKQFTDQLNSEKINQLLMQNIRFARLLGATGFPSLFLETRAGNRQPIPVDYNNSAATIEQIKLAHTA